MEPALSGWLLLLGGASTTVGWVLFALFDPRHERRSDRTWLGFNLPVIFGGLFIALGLVGFLQDRAPWEMAVVLAASAGFAISHLGVHSLETAGELGRLFIILVRTAEPLLLVGGLGFGVLLVLDPAFSSWLGLVLVAAILASASTRFVSVPASIAGGWISAISSATLAWVGVVRIAS